MTYGSGGRVTLCRKCWQIASCSDASMCPVNNMVSYISTLGRDRRGHFGGSEVRSRPSWYGVGASGDRPQFPRPISVDVY